MSISKQVLKTGIFFSTFIPVAASATVQDGADAAQPAGAPANLFTGDTPVFKTIANILIFLVGAISVIMLIVGGLRYVISSGDAGRVKSAKDTILYAIVGLVVAILAYAAVSFVTKSLAK